MPLIIPDNNKDHNCGTATTLTSDVCFNTYAIDDQTTCNTAVLNDEGRFSHCVDICGDIDLGNVTIDNSGVEALLAQLLAEMQNNIESDFSSTPYCTPAGLPIFVGRTISEQDESETWNFYTLDVAGDPVLYAGPREICANTTVEGFEVEAC